MYLYNIGTFVVKKKRKAKPKQKESIMKKKMPVFFFLGIKKNVLPT